MADRTPAELCRAAAALLRELDATIPGGRWSLHEDLIHPGDADSASAILTDAHQGMDSLILSGEWHGTELAAMRVLATLRGAVEPLAELLQDLGDQMADDQAEEKDFPQNIPEARRLVVDAFGQTQHDWTWAVRTARVILGEAT